MGSRPSSTEVRHALKSMAQLDFGPPQLAYLSPCLPDILVAMGASDATGLAAHATRGVSAALCDAGLGMSLSPRTLRELLKDDGWDLIDRATARRAAAITRLRARVTALQGGSHLVETPAQEEQRARSSAPPRPPAPAAKPQTSQPQRQTSTGGLRSRGYMLPYDWSARLPAPRRHDRNHVRTINNCIRRPEPKAQNGEAEQDVGTPAVDIRPVLLRATRPNSR